MWPVLLAAVKYAQGDSGGWEGGFMIRAATHDKYVPLLSFQTNTA